jgi:predicted esterase
MDIQDNLIDSDNKFIFRIINSILMIIIILLTYSCEDNIDYDNPRLTAKIVTPSKNIEKGLSKLTFDGEKRGKLYIPQSYSPNKKMPMLLALHGSGGSSTFWKSYYERAEKRGFIFIALDSRKNTWDAIVEGYGEDFLTIDKTLKYVFDRCYVDEEHIALSGFSDGATYTLSIGPCNGDLFTHLIAHSPGYLIYSEPIVGRPKIYISHGLGDCELSVGCSRDILVPHFIDEGYDVTYNEFTGVHEVPDSISENTIDWFLS